MLSGPVQWNGHLLVISLDNFVCRNILKHIFYWDRVTRGIGLVDNFDMHV
jgi:hypothetical protein